MFKVPIDKIIPVTSARARIASLVNEVQRDKSLYVLTRSGKPVAILASIDHVSNESKNLPEIEKPKRTEIEPYVDKKNVLKPIEEKNTALVRDENVEDEKNVPSTSQDDDQTIEIPIN